MKFLLVIVLLAVAVYLTIRLIERRGLPPSAGPRPRPRRPRRTVAPDDDPEFLRGLDRRRPEGHDGPDRPDTDR